MERALRKDLEQGGKNRNLLEREAKDRERPIININVRRKRR
jgi:hypothetical protein